DPNPGTSGVGDPRARARGQATLAELLEALSQAVPQVRFRLSSIEATEVNDTIARLLIEAPQYLAAHLHAPLQSGSNRLLKRMGRHWYTADSYRARIEWLAARLPAFGLGADIIAGFAGETDADHAATLALVAALPFTYLHVFPFSVRPDAPAARLGGHVTPQIVALRARELRELGERKALAYRSAQRGRRAEGAVSGRAAGRVEVVTEDYLSVYLPVDRWDARRLGPTLLEQVPPVHLVIGPARYRGLPELIARARHGERAADVRFQQWEHYEDVQPARAAGASAFVTVQRGCDYRCTFCIVPMTRGSERSRKLADVVREVAGLAARGTTEVTLLGQTVNSYHDGEHDFADLLRAGGGLPGRRRLR